MRLTICVLIAATSGNPTPAPTIESACTLVSQRRLGAVKDLDALIRAIERNETPLDDEKKGQLARAYTCLAKGYLTGAINAKTGDSEANLLTETRQQLAVIYFQRAFSYDAKIRPEDDFILLGTSAMRDVVALARQQAEVDSQRLAEREQELLQQLERANAKIAEQAERIETLTRKRTVQVAFSVGAIAARPKITDRDGFRQPLWSPLAFLGIGPSNGRWSIGLAEGVGLARNTSPGFVGGIAGRFEVVSRVGVVAGYGVRLSTRDRARRGHDGVAIGVTIRLCRFKESSFSFN